MKGNRGKIRKTKIFIFRNTYGTLDALETIKATPDRNFHKEKSKST